MPLDTMNNKDTREVLFEAIEQLSGSENDTAEFKAAVDSLKTLNDFQSGFYKRDSHGILTEYTAENHASMLELYTNAVRNVTAFLNAKGEKNADELTAAKNVNDLLMRDRNHLAAYDPNEKQNFPALLNSARALTVNAPKDTKAWGGAQSTRIPMTVRNRSGEFVSGVFTPAKTVDPMLPYNKLVAEVSEKYPATAAIFGELLNNFRSESARGKKFNFNGKKEINYDVMNDSKDVVNLLAACSSQNRIDEAMVRDFISGASGRTAFELANMKDLKKAISFFADGLDEFATSVGINFYDLRLEDNDRVDTRNAAMSTMATLLGRPELICRAVPMNVVKDGKTEEGTFMELAEGVDPNHPLADVRYYNPNKDHSPEALRAIADMQVIDYVCGNVDRHGKNFFYQFSREGTSLHFTGIQGIDNDSSFGNIRNPYTDNANRLIGTDNMKVITASMASRLENTSHEMLRFALRGHHLSETSIHSACRRLDHLKNCIAAGRREYAKPENAEKLAKDPAFFKEGFIRVVPDEDFDDLSLSRLAGMPQKQNGKRGDNLFNTVQNFAMRFDRAVYSQDAPDYTGSASRFSKDAMRKNAADVKALVKKLKGATNFRGTSEAYTKMQGSLEALGKLYTETGRQLPDFDSILAVNHALERLRKDCNDYLTHKRDDKDPSGYAKKRMALAEGLIKFADENIIDTGKLTEQEKTDLRHNAEQNLEEINRKAVEMLPKQ